MKRNNRRLTVDTPKPAFPRAAEMFTVAVGALVVVVVSIRGVTNRY